MIDDVWEKAKEDNRKMIELIKPYSDMSEGDMIDEILKKIAPYITRPKQLRPFGYYLIRDDAPEEVRLLHKYITQLADNENTTGFDDDEDYIRDPETGSCYKDGKFLGFKFSDTYKPELKEQGEIYTILLKDPRNIFA